MKVFIQHIESQRFMGCNDAWVPSLISARNFETSLRALDFCFDHRLPDVQIRACFQHGRRDIVWGVARFDFACRQTAQ